jgi:surface carbohydrate biosynthesis protein
MPRVCLILDNPLRDLDGLCLVAWHLAQAGAEVFMVPMHIQGFDIPSLKPDVVLANYVRANNLDLLKLYHRQGIRVAVLDTEGTGEWWPNHAQHLQKLGVESFVDQYCCWGTDQARILLEAKCLPPDQITVTGCPRYDFISQPWRKTLPANDLAPDYILINTNFPVVNPQFAQSTSAEIKGWVKVGWGSQARAEAFAHASRKLFEDIKKAVAALAQTLPEHTFVLRPHPFESMAAYEELAGKLPNLELRKEGTSLQWINHAKALLHVNCFTSIEAGLMQVEALGFEWLNHDEIRQQSSEPFRVSRNAGSQLEMIEWLRRLSADNNILGPLPTRDEALKNLANANYHAIDGQSAQRTSDALLDLAQQSPKQPNTVAHPLGPRQHLVRWLRQYLGYDGATLIKNLVTPARVQHERKQKIPTAEAVTETMERISVAGGMGQSPHVASVQPSDYLCSYQASFKSVRIKPA